jgi:oligoribonuclease NrnB/cAMP/cGMP phosphodiesterase (DHH superfamily)
MLNKILKSIEKQEAPFVCIVHKNCMDGTGAGTSAIELAERYSVDHPTVLFQQYGEEPHEVTGSNLLIMDFTYDRETLLKLKENNNNVYVIDHHASAEKDLKGLDFCYFDMNHSGAYLAWDLLIGRVPKLVKYIEDRDLWKWSLENTKEVSAGLSLEDITDVVTLHSYMMLENTYIKELVENGKVILAYQDMQVERAKGKLNSGGIKIVKFFGYNVPLFNNSNLISEVGNMLCRKHPFSVQYFITDDSIVFSFRANGLVNLTTLQVPRGHPNAAGRSFKLDNIDLNKIFTSGDLGIYLNSIA